MKRGVIEVRVFCNKDLVYTARNNSAKGGVLGRKIAAKRPKGVPTCGTEWSLNRIRYFGLLASLGVVGVIATFVIYQPFMPTTWYREPVLVAFRIGAILCLVLGGRLIWRKPPAFYWVIVGAAALTLPFVLFAHAFGQFDLFSLLFHVEFGTEGASLAGLGDSIAVAVLSCGFFALTVLWFQALVQPQRGFMVAMLAILLVVSPLSRFAFSYLTASVSPDIVTQRLAQPQIIQPAIVPDIVVIYLEGTERSFARTDVFGDVFERISRLEADSISMTNVKQIAGTGWSIAGVSATLCGLPLVPNGLRYRNNFSAQTDFFSDRLCLSDVLAQQGYKPSFLVGADESFGGQKNFLESHSFDTIIGKRALQNMHSKADLGQATVAGVIDDQMLMKTAQSEYLRQRKDGGPVAMFVETYGPHGITSVLSRECVAGDKAELTSDVLAAVDCTALAVERFIDFLGQNRDGRPTAVVLLSDHLNHHPMMRQSLRDEERSNLVILHGLGFDPAPFPRAVRVDRPSSMLDVYPTLLAWLGLAEPDVRAGLGVSVLAEAPTLVEELGREALDRQLIPNPALAKAIWQ